MATKNKRCTIMITSDIEKDVEELKKTMYYDKPYSKLYRDMLMQGISDFMKKNETKQH